MTKFKIYGNRNEKENELELANRLLSRRMAAEGIVLLENNGILPLKDKKIALYGAGARMTVKGGSGSGDVRERYSVNIDDGLKNNGIEVVSNNWLDRFTNTYERNKKEFKEKIENEIKGYPIWRVMDMFKKIGEYQLAYPLGDEIRNDDLSDLSDTCIYVIARQAGEGSDRKIEKGDYLLSDVELKNLKICRNHYKNLIVVINCGSSIDLSWLNDIKVDALIYYGQAGQEGGNALADILIGKENPSGRLSDTWAYKYDDYIVSKYSHLEKYEEDYIEGLYVGYRYFDSANIKALYPFGYGLSYTSFKCEMKNIKAEKNNIFIGVEVENIGQLSGKEVIMSFIFKPNNKYKGELKSLTAFSKTHLLNRGEKEILNLNFDIRDFASYDEENSCFALEKGQYGIAIGKHSDDYQMIAVIEIEEDIITERCKRCLEKKRDFKELIFETEKINYDNLPILRVEIESINNDYDYKLPVVNDIVNKYLDELNDEELAMFTMGGGYFTSQYIKVLGSCGNTTSLLLKKGIPNIIMADGPAGINIMPKSAYTKNGGIRYIDSLPEEWQWGWLKKIMPKLKFLYAGKNDTKVYQYCSAFPNATTVAQTFNLELVEKMGKAVGNEMLVMGITLWLAPALNIHRDPLCGRNFEYYSEDPLVSGLMAAAITRGVQSNDGVGVTIKHFACNNREDERMKVSSNLSERVIREIYLKGFKIACREKPMALMSSYNKINGIYAANNKNLLIDILRCEWGYEGLVMSDWDGVDNCSYIKAIKKGNNMIMPGTKEIYKKICNSLKQKELSRDDVKVSALYALKMIFSAKTTKDFLNNK